MAKPLNTGTGVRVEGLDELRRDLKALGTGLEKELGQVNKRFSEQIASKARSKAQAEGGTAAHTAGGIRASARGTGVFVGLSAASAPGIFGAEFGGGGHGAGNPTAAGGYTTQFGEHRGTRGGALYASVREEAPGMEGAYLSALDQLAAKMHLPLQPA